MPEGVSPGGSVVVVVLEVAVERWCCGRRRRRREEGDERRQILRRRAVLRPPRRIPVRHGGARGSPQPEEGAYGDHRLALRPRRPRRRRHRRRSASARRGECSRQCRSRDCCVGGERGSFSCVHDSDDRGSGGEGSPNRHSGDVLGPTAPAPAPASSSVPRRRRRRRSAEETTSAYLRRDTSVPRSGGSSHRDVPAVRGPPPRPRPRRDRLPARHVSLELGFPLLPSTPPRRVGEDQLPLPDTGPSIGGGAVPGARHGPVPPGRRGVRPSDRLAHALPPPLGRIPDRADGQVRPAGAERIDDVPAGVRARRRRRKRRQR
mmetsp:Transcript_38482/g.115424  ORF Transcript_38482/g.115424 Transcript_38482/m.115424 type:complete len:319 (-) Transcript_38482:1623-2579(-)